MGDVLTSPMPSEGGQSAGSPLSKRRCTPSACPLALPLSPPQPQSPAPAVSVVYGYRTRHTIMQDKPTPHREQRDVCNPADQGEGHALVVPKACSTRIARHAGFEPAEPSRHHGEEVHQIGEHKQGTELSETGASPRQEPEEQPGADEKGQR